MIKFPTVLKDWKYVIERKAKRAGLDFFTTIFEIVDFDQMNELAAYGGFPTRWSHWQFGQEYEYLRKFYAYGVQKIYEMVINNDPCYAYLLEPNSLTDHKMVIAHVYGHNDFFKNNIWFSPVPRNMMDELGNHRYQIDAIKEKVGAEEVENFLDQMLSIDWLIDDHSLMIRRSPKRKKPNPNADDEKKNPRRIGTEQTPFYLEEWLNPVEYMKQENEKLEEDKKQQRLIEKGMKIPLRPTQDILLFLLEHAPLEQWQKQILAIVREENYYFVPQTQTKIMNEGWATYWHTKIMMEMGVCQEKEVIDCADHTSGTLGGFAYKMGYELFNDIEYRWNTGRHGNIWEECDVRKVKDNWDEFIIFKSFFDQSAGDTALLSCKWNDFFTFCEAIKSGESGLPKEIFSKRQLIKIWCDYLNTEALITEQREHLQEAKNDWRKAIRQFSKERKKDCFAQSKETCEKQYQTRLMMAKEDIREIDGALHYLKKLAGLKKNIENGTLLSVVKAIPQEYLEYAQKYPEPVHLGAGKEKIFEVRTFYNDVTFIEEFLTEEICIKMKLFAYEPGGGGVPPDHYGIVSRMCKEVKKKLLFQLTHHGQPIIALTNGNYENRQELYLLHLHEGVDLDIPFMKEVIKIIYERWQKPVHLETMMTLEEKEDLFGWIRKQIMHNPLQADTEEKDETPKGEKIIYSYDGKDFTENKPS